jgi:hypothetical protein
MDENYYSQKATNFDNCDPFRLGQKIGTKMQQLHKTMTHLDEGENLQAIIKQDEQMSKLNVATTQNYDPFR